MAETSSKGNVSFIAVARSDDRVVLASGSHGATIDLSGVKVLISPEQMNQVEVGQHYNFGAGQTMWHLMSDGPLIYICICAMQYPSRHANALLDELRRTFGAKCGEKARTALRESALTKDCAGLFGKLCVKYDDLASIDGLNRTLAKVESVKMIMQENIEVALQNCVSLESIDKQAEDLQAQAGMFKTRAKVLRSKMWWKLCKMRLLVGVLVVVLLMVIIIPLIVMSQKDKSKK